jgi:hypothetical protein
MRIRQIKPEFWKDAKVADLSEGARLFFIGTWQLADDAGWIRWDVANIAAELYPFEGRAARERRVRRHAEALAALGRLHLHDCGHAQVPKMPSHQHLAGTTRRVQTIALEHSQCSKPATPRDSPRLPAPVSIGSGGIGSVSNTRPREPKPDNPHLELVNGEWRPKTA